MSRDADRASDILAVATSLLRAKGYHATSMSEVAEKCGVQKPTLYHHFDSKEALTLAVMARLQACFDQKILVHAHDDSLSAEDRLKRMNAAAEQFFCDDSGGCVFINLALEQTAGTSGFAPAISNYLSRWTDAYRAIFTLVGEPERARRLAEDMTSDLQGAIVLSRARSSPAPLKRLFERSIAALRS